MQRRSFERRGSVTAQPDRQQLPVPQANEDAARGAAAYTPSTLALYDLFVLGFSNSFVWQCPSRKILDFYNEHVSARHLDIGVGTGYFLDKCRFPSSAPTLALFDLNPYSLATAAKRVRRYAPTSHRGNVLSPIDIGLSGFDSIGLNYLLHCLPGTLDYKSRLVFEHVTPLLKNGGVAFGSTILADGAHQTFLAKRLMTFYNAKKIFSNLSDRRQDLEASLHTHFAEHTLRIEGCVALFAGRNANRTT